MKISVTFPTLHIYEGKEGKGISSRRRRRPPATQARRRWRGRGWGGKVLQCTTGVPHAFSVCGFMLASRGMIT